MKLYAYLRDNAWTWAGVAFILVTLSGSMLLLTLTIALVTVLLHWLFTHLAEGKDD
jgi:hypothetical protein